MRRLFLITVLLCAFITVMKAQTVRVNYDRKTVAAMAAAYGEEVVAEKYYSQQVKDILDRYSAAEVAAAGIFASKYLDRKALTELGIWSSRTENYYYRRIYRLVSAKIMPKIWTVAGQMLHSPQTALYWGSYLMKVCSETKSLCMQFESVVTNSRLSFADIAFLEIDPRFAPLFKLSENGGVDWERFFDDLGNIGHNFTKENLKEDIDKLYRMGVGIATAGAENLTGRLLGGSSFHDLINGNVEAIANAVESSYSLYRSLERDMGNTLLSLVGGPENVATLFSLDNYNMTSWFSDYLRETMGQYYTQRWYIYRNDSGSEVMCDYNPPTDDNSVLNGSAWVRINTSDPDYYPTAAQTEQILSNSESHAGWSRARVNQLNAANDGYRYSISYYRQSYVISQKGQQKKKAYAYSIHVTRSWNNTEVVHEDIFDSYTMEINTFKAQFQAYLSDFNDNEEGYVYQIGYDTKNYYHATDAAKLKGCESVIISVTCHDGASLISGTSQYKCKSCGGSLDTHSKSCAMQTTLSGNDLDFSELDELAQEYEQQISVLRSQIDALEAENATLVRQIANASTDEAAALRQQYNENKDSISRLNRELEDIKGKLADVRQAKVEAASDNDVQTDDYYRIPAIMQDCKKAYDITWEDEGHWEGYSYVRKGKSPGINGELTFRATLRISRKPKYFLGIKIHRAIMEISWVLTAEYSDTQVVEIVELDPSASDAEKTKIVNNRISEVAREYPSCEVSTEYIRSEPVESDNTDDTYHLLWSSERLEIARQVDSRLTKIYADLVSLEKMMHYKLSIISVLKSAAPAIDSDVGRHFSIAEKSRRRWLEGASGTAHSSQYDGKYDGDNENER